MNFFDQNSAPAILGNLANYAFRKLGMMSRKTHDVAFPRAILRICAFHANDAILCTGSST